MPSSPKVNKQKALARKMTGRDSNFLGNGFMRDAAQFVGKAANMYGDAINRDPVVRASKANLKVAEQFASKAAKNVIRDVQGAAKMVMKGFGN